MRSPHTTTREQPPLATTREESAHSSEDPAQSQTNKLHKGRTHVDDLFLCLVVYKDVKVFYSIHI